MQTKEAGGLFVKREGAATRVPLRGVSIEASVTGVAARVSVAQRYQNLEKVPVEAVYSFPLDASAAVCGFEVEVGGKRIVGKVEEREKAFEKYDQAVAEGHGAFLVDQDRPNIFTASVGNLLPGQEVVVKLSYVSELPQTKDSLRVLIPTTISPRYIPPDQARTMDAAELDHLNPPVMLQVPYGLTLNVNIDAGSDIREIASLSHPAQVRVSGKTAQVSLVGQNIQLDQDFVLTVALADAHKPSAIVARDSAGVRAVMVNLIPDLSGLKRAPCEYLFIIDRSGSMDGPSIAQARSALQLALRSLDEGDYFNVIGFGTSYEPMFPASVAYDETTLTSAAAKVGTMEANLGGTEMLAPVRFALEAPRCGELPRQVVLLTDGQIGNEAQLIELAGKHSGTRLFTFGVGHGVSEHLLKSLARVSKGAAELIHPNERIEPVVMRQFARMASPALSNVRVDWGGLQTDLQAPMEMPPVFSGDTLTLYARVIGGSAREVTVLADSANGPLRFSAPIDLERASDERSVPVLMARKAIQELEEGRGAVRGSAQANRKENAARAKILELALRYQVLSSATSLVAIEERAEGSQAQAAELRRIPVALTKGWGGAQTGFIGAVAGGAGAVAMSAPMPMGAVRRSVPMGPPAAAPRKKTMMAKARELIDGLSGGIKSECVDATDGDAPPPPSNRSRFMESDPDFDSQAAIALLNLVGTQRADGSFSRSTQLEQLVPGGSTKLDELEHALRDSAASVSNAAAVIATVAALGVLERQFAESRDMWKMLAEKAERWLAKQNVPAPAGFSVLTLWVQKQLWP